MEEHEREALEQLNRYWDALLTGTEGEVGEFDAPLADAVRQLHALDDVPTPDRDFARQLGQRLDEQLDAQPRPTSWRVIIGSIVPALQGLMPRPAFAVAITLLLALGTYLAFNALPPVPVPSVAATTARATGVNGSLSAAVLSTPTATAGPLGAWRTYTNTAGAYAISYPSDWFLQADEKVGSLFITSFPLAPTGGGGIPAGSVKIDISNTAAAAADAKQARPFCVDGECGTRFEQKAPFAESAAGGLDRTILIRIPKGDSSFQVSALIAEPASEAERNATIVEQVIASLRFVRIAPLSPRPEAQRQAAIANIRTCLGKPDLVVEYKSTARSTYRYELTSEFYLNSLELIEVDTRTNQVVQIGPVPMPLIATPKPLDFTPRYTPEQLQAMARAFIARCANIDLGKLTYNQGEKGGGPSYFFRWQNETPPKPAEGYPFIQVGYTRGGDFLSFGNTLGLASQPGIVPTAPAVQAVATTTAARALPPSSSTPHPTPTVAPLPSPLPTRAPYVSHLIVSPNNPLLLFALTSDRRLMRSDDGGMTWSALTTSATGARMLTGMGIDYRHPQTLYLTTDKGIFRSDDSGITWVLLNSMVAQNIAVSFDDPNVLWTTAGNHILRSDDGGQRWSDVSSGLFVYGVTAPILIDPENSNILYMATTSDTRAPSPSVYRGTRDGQWKEIAAGLHFCCFLGTGLAWSTHTKALRWQALAGNSCPIGARCWARPSSPMAAGS